jgi:hypothetical protein
VAIRRAFEAAGIVFIAEKGGRTRGAHWQTAKEKHLALPFSVAMPGENILDRRPMGTRPSRDVSHGAKGGSLDPADDVPIQQ